MKSQSPFFPLFQQTGHEAHTTRTALTRIPMSKNLKTGKTVLGTLGMSGGVRLESRVESQSMRIEVKKSTVNSSGLHNGGKAWGEGGAGIDGDDRSVI